MMAGATKEKEEITSSSFVSPLDGRNVYLIVCPSHQVYNYIHVYVCGVYICFCFACMLNIHVYTCTMSMAIINDRQAS